MTRQNAFLRALLIFCLAALLTSTANVQSAENGRLLTGQKVVDTVSPGPNPVRHRCLTPDGNPDKLGGLQRASKYSLPTQALPSDFDSTLHVLVLRFNFQYEETDDPNTTGRGRFDMSRPLDTLTDAEYIQREGHIIDPPPHDSAYFDAHLKALNRYWEKVSEDRIHLTWDVYPPFRDSAYTLPHPMSYYGKCDFADVVGGLEDYFTDCIKLADTAQLLHPGDEARWDIDFSQYQAFFLFHAGSDRQSDIGFPETCSDLFSGFIRFGGSVEVDGGAEEVNTALLMPETVVQDNRVSAMNALIAHEFGHQLGLIDVYDSRTFMTQLGDFALMDNNGFGTGVAFEGFTVGNVFGTCPVYPCAWSRAYLGFADVVELRDDTNHVSIVAAAAPGDSATKVVRIPISETEYYLLDNRVVDIDGKQTALLADAETSVIQGPINLDKEFTGEYDDLAPGSGLMVTLIDEEIAGLDYDGDGQNNFDDNDLQWWLPSQRRKFITLIEADGLTTFGGYFRAGYGSEADLYRDDRNTALTPNTNPPSQNNSGGNSHIYITNIARDTLAGGVRNDLVISFDFEIDRKVTGFPVRVGRPSIPIAPIADDLDNDGEPEVIAVAGKLLTVATSTGDDFIRTKSTCDTLTCPLYYDTVITSVHRGVFYNPAVSYAVPVYAEAPADISAGPVTGDFGVAGDKLVAIGYPQTIPINSGRVMLYEPTDDDDDARADLARAGITTTGKPIALSFGDKLYILTDASRLYILDSLNAPLPLPTFPLTSSEFYGVAQIGSGFLAVGIHDDFTRLHYVDADGVTEYDIDGQYVFGPAVADLDRDGVPEIVLFDLAGDAMCVSLDTEAATPTFSISAQRSTGNPVSTNPVIGDMDADGYPDIVIGGIGMLYAYDRYLTTMTDFPMQTDDRYPDSVVIAAPVIADISREATPELVFPTSAGNMYAYGLDKAFGFPVSNGRQKFGVSGSSAVIFNDSTGGKLAYLGGDGWLYAWEVDADTVSNYWPMTGGGPEGTFEIPDAKFATPAASAGVLDEKRFYNYPNPTSVDSTVIRYYLDGPATSVTFNIYDMSGTRVDELSGTTLADADNEVVWQCGKVVPGVYRCVIEVKYPSGTKTAFKDIAVVR